MTSDNAIESRANLVGSLWMVLSMAVFSLEDVMTKTASSLMPIGQVLILMGMGGALIFASVATARKERLFSPEILSKPMRIRVVFEVLGRLFYILALALTPLSSATVILQATPLVVVAGAALIFGEKVGWRRWTAIAIGLLGVVVIIKPGTDSFSILSVLALLGMIGFAGRDLASRAAPASLSTAILGLYGFLSIIAAGVLYSLWERAAFVPMDMNMIRVLCGAILAGAAGYACLMKAMRIGEVSAVTPFRYSRLIFGIACGVFLFHETLTPSMMVGSGLIVISGLFIVMRSKKAAVAALDV